MKSRQHSSGINRRVLLSTLAVLPIPVPLLSTPALAQEASQLPSWNDGPAKGRSSNSPPRLPIRRAAILCRHAEPEYAYGPAQGLPDTGVGTFSQAMYDTAIKQGWIIVSMKNDWKRHLCLRLGVSPSKYSITRRFGSPITVASR